jgi:hypothetical protein
VIPKLKVHDAEQCYREAKKLQDEKLFNITELTKLVKEGGAES